MASERILNANCKGFSLVELMITLAVISILIGIGKVNYNAFILKAQTAEAKAALTMVYTSEIAFRAEWNSYSSCLVDIGYTEANGKRYFTIGFGSDRAEANSCGPDGHSPCNSLQWMPNVACSHAIYSSLANSIPVGANTSLPTDATLVGSGMSYVADNAFSAVAI